MTLCCPGPSLNAQRASTAADVMARAAAALGGLDRLQSIGAIMVEEQAVEWLIGIWGDPAIPPKTAFHRRATLRSHGQGAIRWTRASHYPMREGEVSRTVLVRREAAASITATGMRPASWADWRDGNLELDLAPERVVITARAAADLARLADTLVDGKLLQRVSFTAHGARVVLLLDARTALPAAVVVEASPSNAFVGMWGTIPRETWWGAWALTADGLWYPRQRSRRFNGEPEAQAVVITLALRPSVPEADLTIPTEIAAAGRPQPPTSSGALPRPRCLGDDLLLFEGGYQTLVIRQPDGLVVIDAPVSTDQADHVLITSTRATR